MSVSEGMESTENSGNARVLCHEDQEQSPMMQQSADAHRQVHQKNASRTQVLTMTISLSGAVRVAANSTVGGYSAMERHA